jgi:hypothetical protein
LYTSLRSKHTPLSEKAKALGSGTFPHAALDCVSIPGKVDYGDPEMSVQFSPDRIIITISKNITPVNHSDIDTVEVSYSDICTISFAINRGSNTK